MLIIYVSDVCTSQFSQDSFICPTQETLFTNINNSMNIDLARPELNEECFLLENYSSENNKNPYQKDDSYYQSRSACLTSFYLSSEKLIQVLSVIYFLI